MVAIAIGNGPFGSSGMDTFSELRAHQLSTLTGVLLFGYI
jgi:hypothetical protein